MRLLIVSPSVPDPSAHHGGAVYVGHLARALGRYADLGLVAFRSGRCPAQPVGFHWSATAVRRENHQFGRVALRVNQLRLARRWLGAGLPLVAAKHHSRAVPALLRRALDEFRPDAALVEFAPMAQYLRWLGSVPTVFTDHEGAHPVTAFRAGSRWDRRDRILWQRYVRRFYPLADRIQALTVEDADEVGRFLGRPVAIRQPFVHLPDGVVAPGRARPVALFLGDYRHHPNPEAARIVAFDLWPQVRAQVPDAELWLAGRTEADELAGLERAPGVKVLGFVADLDQLLNQCRCMVAPVFSGGGSRIKVLTALAHGLPVVTNALGARGVTAEPPAVHVVEQPQAMVAPTVRLLTEPDFADAAGAAARQWATHNLSPDGVAQAQVRAVEALLRARA